jgi:predicted RNA binding protein YcfA (HicA-like mRNA interferase family)
MAASRNKHAREIKKFAKTNGWSVEQANNGHYKLKHPDIKRAVFVSSTPSCKYAFNQAVAEISKEMRNHGLEAKTVKNKSKKQKPVKNTY